MPESVQSCFELSIHLSVKRTSHELLLRECSLFMGRGGWQMGGGGGKRSLLPYLGGVRKVLLWIWGRGGGGGTKNFEGQI